MNDGFTVTVARDATGRIVTFHGSAKPGAHPYESLTVTLHELFTFLTDVEHLDPDLSAVIDLQLEEMTVLRAKGEAHAFLHAVRGVMQSWVIERRAASCSVNLVVSYPQQEKDRELTIEYLLSATGSFSRGSTIDLREGAV